MNNLEVKEIHEIFLQSTGVCIDTRKIIEGCIFFAIKGERFDGNDFANLAIEKGASFAIVSDERLVGDQFIQVKDTLKCLQNLSSYHRDFLDIPILAITGSNGKTTTKELCAQVLSAKFKLKYTEGNLNNHIGVPLTLLSFDHTLEFAIVEMGANHLKEIEELCLIAKPNFGLITNIGKAHIGEFGGAENIKKAKLELFDHIRSTNGFMFYNEEYDAFSRMKDYENSLAYSNRFLDNKTLEIISTDPNITIRFNEHEKFEVALGGVHNVENIKAAIACGFHFGLDPNKIKEQLQAFKAPSNRSQWLDTGRNKIFLDAYNANPTSVEMAINYFSSLESEHKMIIIGDMFELGDHTSHEHKIVYDRLIEEGIEFFLIGDLFYQNCKDSTHVFQSKSSFLESIKNRNVENYSILIKASRSMKLESLVDIF